MMSTSRPMPHGLPAPWSVYSSHVLGSVADLSRVRQYDEDEQTWVFVNTDTSAVSHTHPAFADSNPALDGVASSRWGTETDDDVTQPCPSCSAEALKATPRRRRVPRLAHLGAFEKLHQAGQYKDRWLRLKHDRGCAEAKTIISTMKLSAEPQRRGSASSTGSEGEDGEKSRGRSRSVSWRRLSSGSSSSTSST